MHAEDESVNFCYCSTYTAFPAFPGFPILPAFPAFPDMKKDLKTSVYTS